jgi:ubiquinone/menaquinone biosynthesis C-methylase UbiE
MISLDVGCGQRQRGDVNVDIYKPIKKPRSEFVLASSAHLPFKDDSFEQVFCHHMLEHLENPYPALKELIRVSSYTVKCIVPHGTHPYSHIDTDHKSFFSNAGSKRRCQNSNATT